LSTAKNITWAKNDEDDIIYLANAKISDYSSSLWITVCAGGDTIFDTSAKEAARLQAADRASANDKGNNPMESNLKNMLMRRKGCGFWIKLRAQKNTYQGRDGVKFTTIAAYSSLSENDPNGQKMNRALLNTLKQLKKSKGISG